MKSLIPTFRDSVLTPSTGLVGEWTEIGIDALIQNDILKEIPIVNTLSGICKVGYNLHERNLLEQTLTFIQGFNSGKINEERLKAYREEIIRSPKKAERELGRVIIILNSQIETIQSQVLGKFYRAYVNGAVSWEKFCELSEANRRMFAIDYALLEQQCRNQNDQLGEKREYQYDRLVSLGLLSRESIATGSTDGGNSIFPVVSTGTSVTSFGKTFYHLMHKHRDEA